MKLCKKIGVTLLTIFLIIGMTGCMFNKKKSPEEIKDEALAYLNSYYDDEFTPVMFEGPSWAYNYYTIFFESKKYDGQCFKVYKFKDEPDKFYDGYFKLAMNADACSFFEEIVSQKVDIPVTIKVGFGGLYLSKEVSPNATFAECIGTGEFVLQVYVFSNEDIPHETQKQILSSFIEKKNALCVTFYTTKDTVDTLKNTLLEDIIASATFLKSKFYSISKDFTIEESEERVYY